MMNNRKILVIGGTACGPKAAARARRCDPRASITIIEQGENLSTATCGYPYYISGLIRSQGSLLVKGPDYFKETLNIDVMVNTVATKIDPKSKTVVVFSQDTGNSAVHPYDRLVLATGASPVVPEIDGSGLGGIFTLSKLEDAEKIKNFIAKEKVKKAVLVGAGFIGMEMAETFAALKIDVEIVEAQDWVMPAFLDFEIARNLEIYLAENGIKIHCGWKVTGFEGNKKGMVTAVVTSGGTIETRMVLLAIGTRPNSQLAKDAGLKIGERGGISVDGYMITSDPSIYAGGDCVENLHRITGKKVLVALGSTANKHGRIIGTNVTGGSQLFPGVLGTAIAKVFDYNIGRVGLTEKEAWASGYSVVTSIVEGNEHATYYPGSKKFLLKMIANSRDGRVLGAQAVGPGEVAKRIDVLATALSFGASVKDISNLDLAYAPPYNGPIDPVHHAANTIDNKMTGLAKSLTPAQVKAKLDRDEDFILLDVRSMEEWKTDRIEGKQVKLVPIDELRTRLSEIPRDREIITLCHSSVRAYQAQRILHGSGYVNVKFMDGSMAAWPFDTANRKAQP
jgi:NADPH-dependent 2,4-dienoyl-CoA reductase/sulfur reductase-like enzyme/rhodanese-related sulfurtransferase